MDKFVDMLMTKLVDPLMLSPCLADMDSTDNMDGTTLGKAHPDKSLGMPNTMGTRAGPFVSNMGKQTIMGCPVAQVPARTSGVAHA